MRIPLVDDHEIVGKGMRSLLEAEPGLEVVGEAGSAGAALRRVGFDSPDIVVLDVRLPDGSGVEACRDTRSAFADVKVLMLTSFADEDALRDVSRGKDREELRVEPAHKARDESAKRSRGSCRPGACPQARWESRGLEVGLSRAT